MAVPLLALGAIARLAILDDAEASTYLLSHLDTWAWAVGILLILADLVLPVPQASVITALARSMASRWNPDRNSRPHRQRCGWLPADVDARPTGHRACAQGSFA
jgi:hypothetical protein